MEPTRKPYTGAVTFTTMQPSGPWRVFSRRRLLAALVLALVAAGAWNVQVVPGFVRKQVLFDLGHPGSFLADTADLGPSTLGYLAWRGTAPLQFRKRSLRRGDRIELRLRTALKSRSVRVLVDGRQVARIVVVPRWRTFTVWLRRSGALLTLQAVAPGRDPVHCSRIKITNVAGYVEGVVNGYLVFDPGPVRVSRLLHPKVGVFLLALLLGLPWSVKDARSGPLRTLHWAIAGPALIAALEAMDAASELRAVEPATTFFILLLAPIGAAAVSVLAVAIRKLRPGAIPTGGRRPWRGAVVVALTALALWAPVLYTVGSRRFAGDIRGFARFGWKFHAIPELADVARVGKYGYDGQFYETLATDPLLRSPVTRRAIDNPTYRARRVLLPLAAYVLSAGSASTAPRIYVLLCWLLPLAGVALVAWWLAADGRSAYWALPLALTAGIAVSMLRATPDGAAAALIVAALFASDRNRPRWMLALTTLAVLARETSLLIVPGLALLELRRGRRVAAGLVAALPAALITAWRLHLRSSLGITAASALGNFGVPFGWVPAKINRLCEPGAANAAEVFGLLAIPLLLIAAAAVALPRRRRSPVEWSLLGFSGLALFLNLRVYAEIYAYSRVLVVVPFLALILAAGEPVARRRWILAGLVAACSLSGLFVIRGELKVVRSMRHMRVAALGTSGVLVRLSGRWRVDGGRWRLQGPGNVSLASAGKRSMLALDVLQGRARFLRNGSVLTTLGPGSGGAFPIGPGSTGSIEVRPIGGGVAFAPPRLLPFPRIDTSVPGNALVVPGFGSGPAADGGSWRSRLRMNNPAAAPTRVRLIFLERGETNSRPATIELFLAPHATIRLADAARALFAGGGFGTLLVTFDGEEPHIATTMIHSTARGEESFPLAVVRASARLATRSRLQFGPLPAEVARPNLGLTNLGAVTRRVDIEVRAAGDRAVLDRRIELGPWQVRSLRRLLRPRGLLRGATLTVRWRPPGPVIAYLSVAVESGHGWRVLRPTYQDPPARRGAAGPGPSSPAAASGRPGYTPTR